MPFMSRLLLLSNSTMPGTPFFTWPRPFVKTFLGREKRNLVFVPFAAVTFSFDEYAAIAGRAFEEMGYTVTAIHAASDMAQAVRESDGVVVGGGNSFALLKRAYDHGLIDAIRTKVQEGAPYIGWSAGANFACPTIKTTNDMPIVLPPALDALGLVPFQINPHYHELKFEKQGGETRKERLEEFLVLNPGLSVVGLPEGMGIMRDGNELTLVGDGIAKLYTSGTITEDLKPGPVNSLLKKH
jgi:dipeptidase E